MLTDLSFLQEGAVFPPVWECARIETYKTNEQLFLTQHTAAWKSDFDVLSRALRKKNTDIETIFNYQQLLSKKTADFVCSEPPTIETEQDTDAVSRLLERERWGSRLYEAIIDVSRYGNAVLKLVGKSLTAVSPLHWFPIVAPSDLKSIIQHVIAYPIKPDSEGKMTELYAEIHSIGRVESQTFSFDSDSGKIGKLLATKSETTGISDFAVQILTNITHSGSIYGLDDYGIINSIVKKLLWRLHCADSILDKHSDPSISGPRSALSRDERTGLFYLDLGNYFSRNTKEDADVSYITWDGNLESNFKEIDMLLAQIYTLTEMGQAFMEGGGGGDASSGTALKLRMVSPRIKAARLIGMNDAAVKQIILLLAKINGISLDADGLTLHWSDGLPADEVERVTMLVTATSGKPIMSQYAAMKRLGLSDGEVEAEQEALSTEAAASAPLVLASIDKNADEVVQNDDTETA